MRGLSIAQDVRLYSRLRYRLLFSHLFSPKTAYTFRRDALINRRIFRTQFIITQIFNRLKFRPFHGNKGIA